MSKYDLINGATATQANPGPSSTQQVVTPPGPNNPNMPPQEQTFHLEVTGVGNVSASAQIMVSNDDGNDPSLYNWINYGDVIAAPSTANLAQASAGGTQPWRNFTARITAISGTNASASVRMSA